MSKILQFPTEPKETFDSELVAELKKLSKRFSRSEVTGALIDILDEMDKENHQFDNEEE